MNVPTAAATYQQNAILTASPEKLVKLLYEGAIRNLERARIALGDAKTAKSALAGEALGKALGILGELRASLDHQVGGELSRNLDRLYEFGIDRITKANVERSPEALDGVLKVLRSLREGWDAVIPG
jgi:flagellar protein FliS